MFSHSHIPHARVLYAAACPTSPSEAFAGLTTAEFSDLRHTLSECSGCRGVAISELIESLQVPEQRHGALGFLVTEPSLLCHPFRRAAVLEALTPFAHEPLVTEYALLSLLDAQFANSGDVASAAANVIQMAGEALAERQMKRLVQLAALSYGAAPTIASSFAQAALRNLPVSDTQSHCIIEEARQWYLTNRSVSNPWLVSISKHVSLENVRFMQSIVDGTISYTKKPSLLRRLSRFPQELHEIAICSVAVAGAFKQALGVFGLAGQLDNAQACVLGATVVYGWKFVIAALLRGSANTDRGFERVEAIAHLALLRERAQQDEHQLLYQCIHEVNRTLERAGTTMSQAPAVQAAAMEALHKHVTPEGLWRWASQFE